MSGVKICSGLPGAALDRLRHAPDANCPPAGIVNFHDYAVKHHPVARDLEPLRHVGDEPFDNRFNFSPQHALVRTGEASVTQIGRTAGKNLLIGRLHVCMRSDYRAHLPIQHPGKRDFLRGGLGVDIHKDDLSLFTQACDLRRREQKRIFQRRHEGSPLHIEHSDH